MSGYAPKLPQDQASNTLQEFATPKKALARYGGENSSASSVISLTEDTTAIEVAAVGQAAVIRWVPATETAAVTPFASVISVAGSTANFDNIVPVGQVRRFVVPIEIAKVSNASVMGRNVAFGLYKRVAIKTTGIGSVLTAEY